MARGSSKCATAPALLNDLVDKGYMSLETWRCGRVVYGEAAPAPGPNEVVAFAQFFEWGLDFLVSRFLQGIPFNYGLGIHHLNPNTVFHLSIFTTLCKAWLGIKPNLDVLKLYFCTFAVLGDSPFGCTRVGLYTSDREVLFITVPLMSSVPEWQPSLSATLLRGVGPQGAVLEVRPRGV
jgi:hypothetical protein